MAFNADDDGGNWFDANAPTNRAPANTMRGPTGPTPGPWAGGYVPYYPDPDPNTPGNQNPDMPQNPSLTPAAATTPSGDPATQFQAYLAKYPGNPQAAIDAWNAAGDPGGLKPAWEAGSQTIGLANGSYLVAPGTGGNGGSGWQTVQRTPEGPSSADASGLAAGDLLKPFTEQFAYDKFAAPTNITEQNDPGYQARLAANQDALQRGAAAKGTLLTGQTQKDLGDMSQTFASNEYGNVYNRAAQDYNTNYGNAYNQYLGRESTFYANQNNPFAKLLATSTLDSQNANAANQVSLGYAGLNSNNMNQANQLGFNYASLYSNTLGQGANNYGNYLTQGANANAAGQVANGNIWGNTFNNAGNTALGLYYNSQKPPTSYPGQYGGY